MFLFTDPQSKSSSCVRSFLQVERGGHKILGVWARAPSPLTWLPTILLLGVCHPLIIDSTHRTSQEQRHGHMHVQSQYNEIWVILNAQSSQARRKRGGWSPPPNNLLEFIPLLSNSRAMNWKTSLALHSPPPQYQYHSDGPGQYTSVHQYLEEEVGVGQNWSAILTSRTFEVSWSLE